jgi:hypothetical protein
VCALRAGLRQAIVDKDSLVLPCLDKWKEGKAEMEQPNNAFGLGELVSALNEIFEIDFVFHPNFQDSYVSRTYPQTIVSLKEMTNTRQHACMLTSS